MDVHRAAHFPVVTLAACVANVTLYLFVSVHDVRDYVAYDADSPLWFVSITYLFFHLGLGHMVSNVVFLFVLGCLVETIEGHLRTLLIMLHAGAIGALLHGVLSDGMVVGSSCIVLALTTYQVPMVVNNFTTLCPHASLHDYRTLRKIFFSVPMRLATVFVIVSAELASYALDASSADTSHASHFGGALSGLTLGLAVCRISNPSLWKSTLVFVGVLTQIWWIFLAWHTLQLSCFIVLMCLLPVITVYASPSLYHGSNACVDARETTFYGA